MDEGEVRELVRQVRDGRVSRRQFTRMMVGMNDLLVRNVVVIPLVWRSWVSGVSNRLKGTEISGWDSSFWNLARWYREA
ncbi:MAG: hypothetical protein HYV62_13145 [Candidatus Rokubacteria bacterium]|nr:hypothetical protein [Candidatus Rokubacteria bacterium]